MRWTALDQAYSFAQTNHFPFNFHVLLWGNQQPTWMATLPPEEQLVEIKKWFAAVAARYPNIEWLQVVNEATWDPPDRQYFPNTKLMLNDVAITGMTEATDEYLKIINILKRENLIDTVGIQAHAFEFIAGVTNAPTIPGHPYQPVTVMAVHKANLDRLAATGVPMQVTELDLDGLPVGGVAGWEHPAIKGVTLWGWRQPNHWRNAQNAPLFLTNGTLKPAAEWLFAYVRGIAPVIRPDHRFTLGDDRAVGTVVADDWASRIGRANLRTFKWRITGGSGAFAIEPATGELRIADQRLIAEHTNYPLKVRVSDGFHESDEVEVTVATGELANVDDVGAGATVPATLALSLGSGGFGAFVPGVARDYETSVGATITTTAGDAALSVLDPATASPGKLVNGAFALAHPVQAAVAGPFTAVSGAPLTVHTYAGPASNDALTLRFKQTIGASEPLRTGAYSKTLTFTLSTTAP